ncbi:unnamed protein product [Urochloa decumbens]|uniref:Uncharacterized protein n=1 Tax=Urochloa decumbens TaxID=240449 RepID=A0ABC9BZM1_9POAL
MSLRRFVHLVANEIGDRGCYSLRRIDTSRLFFPRAIAGFDFGAGAGAAVVDLLALPPDGGDAGPLPDPVMDFYPPPPPSPGMPRPVDFMLLGSPDGQHDEVVSVDNKGSTLVTDAGAASSRRLPGLARPKGTFPIISLTAGDTLYAMDALPTRFGGGAGFQSLRRGEGHWRDLHPHPLSRHETHGFSHLTVSYAAGTSILVSSKGAGTYSFDTAERPLGAWSLAGDWAMPFRGLAVHVPEHRLWFGISLSGSGGGGGGGHPFCAANLACGAGAWGKLWPPAPAIHGLWMEYALPEAAAGWRLVDSRAVYLGASRFCIVRLFEVVSWRSASGSPYDEPRQVSEGTHALFTGVEVQSCGQALRVLRHRSE